MRTKHYSDYLNSIAGLIGVAESDLQNDELTILNGFFNKAMKYIWQQTSWLDVCPYGEYRVPNNLLSFGKSLDNDLWTLTNITVTADATPNPVDVQTQADLVLETSATGVHSVSQTTSVFQTQYAISIFVQAAGRNYVQLKFTDSASTVYSAIFNVAGTNGGTVVSNSANTTTQINQVSGLWYQCSITFSPATGTGTALASISTDGSTVSYAGDVTKGLYLWGFSFCPTMPSGVSTQLIPWEQTGEEAIDIVYDAFNASPIATSYPSKVGYRLTNNGVQIINSTTGWNAMYYIQNPAQVSSTTSMSPLSPVYLYYRQRVPNYSGTAYSGSSTYAVGNQILFTDSNSNKDYYVALNATTAGQSPSTNPSKWKLLPVPFSFFDYCVYSSYADWLRTEGQLGKAIAMDQFSEDLMIRETDRQERQMMTVQPMKVFTHLTSRPNYTR